MAEFFRMALSGNGLTGSRKSRRFSRRQRQDIWVTLGGFCLVLLAVAVIVGR